MLGTRTPTSNLLDPERSQHRGRKRKSVRARDHVHTKLTEAQPLNIRHVQRERRRRIMTVTGILLKAFDSRKDD